MKHFVIDILAVLVFAILARMAHGGLGVVEVLDTFWPFAVGTVLAWAVIRNRPEVDLGSGVIAWLFTAVTGLVIWALRHAAVPHWSFIIVATVMSGLLLVGWRVIAKVLVRGR
ncbi:DUF3054 domain-containing protein [Corynebacterium sp. 153RC1]|uniref:DUF3054 domain-containing protein n=1 Tax=unclassified Corynebacterium TaxID=2624378 RepID=UPI00211CB49D|nr:MULTISPECIES: DUF3054 domain-containing protein [unclassified Corynebacterium]MCQ9370856.1 DUF3054 domain-containing protein [Corynebacterium sp. 35RC1]MCQ9352685.1 DUF3054 domain-containing protein [Corynebacterium sp. 209RC1]MCQ9354869.1 DUF3054 domain-containing protein [Corynebacterium sp. 1222RC1]MCQ9357054.1 DUF3054 domain-containing protein [Corynebacterium sp. 122RC1]MCQ9359300.1 DUF3054 domain-containing protein [Corynebacterium sp. 142RC1]